MELIPGFRSGKERRKKIWGGGGGGEGEGRIAVNPIGTKVVCFFRFLLRVSLSLMFAALF